VRAIGAALEPVIAELNEASDGAVIAHGHGALWGGLFAHADPKARTAANLQFKAKCAEARVLPYFVPIGGFMLTPRYDDDPEAYAAAVKDMAQCAVETCREMGWAQSALLPLAGPPPEADGAEAQLRLLKGNAAVLEGQMDSLNEAASDLRRRMADNAEEIAKLEAEVAVAK